MKKIWILVIGGLFIGNVYAFPDVNIRDAAYDAVQYLEAEGLVSGYPDGTFRAGQAINRIEFVKLVIGAGYSPVQLANCSGVSFPQDTQENQWYSPYLCIALRDGVVAGYPDGTFRPTNQITLVEAAKVLALSQNLSVTNGDQWYTGFVMALQEQRAIPDTVTQLDEALNRGQMAQMLYRVLAKVTNRPTSTLIAQDAPERPMPPTMLSAPAMNEWQSEIFEQTNQIRLATTEPLQFDPQLAQLAQAYTEQMVQEGFFNHVTPDGLYVEDRLENATYEYVYYGENIGRGAKTPEQAMEYWIESPPHYTNMVNPNFTHMGIGYTKSKETDKPYHNGYYWAVIFTSKK